MTFRVVVDTNVLAPAGLHDIVLTLASGGLFQPIWSDDILEELERTLREAFQLTDTQIQYRLTMMAKIFPEANVRSYKSLVEGIDCTHVKDRHVLAVAIASGAGAIVTDNLKDFPKDLFELHGIELLHPDDFLESQFSLSLPVCVQRIARILRRYKDPKYTVTEMVDYYSQSLPKFSAAILENRNAIEFYLSLE
jgi:predicted nucleic acid-binding protein